MMTAVATHPIHSRTPGALQVTRLVGLLLIGWGVFSELPPGLAGRHLVGVLLFLAAVPPWLDWTLGRRSPARLTADFVLLGLAGGALAARAPVALSLVGTAALGAAATFPLRRAFAIGALGPLSLGIVAAFTAGPAGLIAGGAAVALAGLVIGVGRQQATERATQAAAVALEHERAEVAAERAAVLAERNRLARDIHDVLAHTLSAIAIQLEALDAQLSDGAVRNAVRTTRALSLDGLAEARHAVTALRGEVAPLPAQLERLANTMPARLVVTGDVRPLGGDETLALYRVAQEALTNATKHAPGAAVTIELSYDERAVVLGVENAAPNASARPLAGSGGGYGLGGISERIGLLGGALHAGPSASGWRVEARLER